MPPTRRLRTFLKVSGDVTAKARGVVCLSIDIEGESTGIVFGGVPILAIKTILRKAFIDKSIRLIQAERNRNFRRTG